MVPWHAQKARVRDLAGDRSALHTLLNISLPLIITGAA